MNWRKAGWLAVAMVALGVAGAQAEFVRGDINGWTATVGMDTNRGFAGDQFYSVTLTGTVTRVSSGFQFTQHATWDPQWGTGSRATNAVVNSTIGQGQIKGRQQPRQFVIRGGCRTKIYLPAGGECGVVVSPVCYHGDDEFSGDD